MDLPVAFLPFNPHREYKPSDDSSSSQTDDEDESSEEHSRGFVANGEHNLEQNATRHIGGGVLLVSR